MIGIDDYENFSKLKTPLNDVKTLGKVLHEKYDFEIQLINPTRKTDYINFK